MAHSSLPTDQSRPPDPPLSREASGVRLPLPPLAEIARLLADARDVGEVLQRVAEGALEISGASSAYVEQVISPSGTVEVVAAAGDRHPPLGTRVPYPGSLTEEMIEGAGPIPLTELDRIGQAIAPYLTDWCEGCSALVVPLFSEQEVLGTLVLLRRPGERPYSEAEVAEARLLGDLASASLRRVVLLEETRREREEKTALLESTGEGVYGTDLEGRCTFINRSGARMVGYQPEEVLGRNMHDLIHSRHADGSPYPEEECPIFLSFRAGVGVRVDTEVLWRADGSCFPAEYASYPLVQDGEKLGAVVTFADITERRRAERALRTSEARYRALAETASDAIVVMDDEGMIQSANPAVERIFGWSAEELVGRPLSVLIPESMREAHDRGVERYLRTGKRHISWNGLELPGLCRDGTEVPLEISFAEYQVEGEHRFAGFIRDVTERRRAETEREALLEAERRARGEAERALRVRDEVLGIVSHDLRNPLNTVLMSASTLLDIPLPEEQRVRQLGIIHRSAERMNRLIQDLLDVARIDAGAFSVDAHPVDPGHLVRESYESFRSLAAERSLSLECELRDGLPRVCADRDRILQVLSNLLGNALKFTEAGGEVAVGARDGEGEVLFWVRDTGVGIAAGDLAHLFDAYWQARKTAHLGAGLGLSISRGIVEAHGGRISVESEVGRGTTFRFTIPHAP